MDVAIFLLLVIPGAYVSVHNPSLSKLTPYKRYSIAVMGPWHNLSLALILLLVLTNLPIVLSPAYHKSVNELMIVKSSLYKLKGNIIVGVNGLIIEDGVGGFAKRIETISNESPTARCVPVKMSEKSECCESNYAKERGVNCIWDLISLSNYKQIAATSNINVVSKYCTVLKSDYTELSECNSNADCNLDEICGSRFTNGLLLNLTLRNQWTKLTSNITYIGTLNNLVHACI